MEISEATLIKLTKNPNYKLSEKELQALDEYRKKHYQENLELERIKHDTTFEIHPTGLKKESKSRKRNRRG